MTDPLSRVRAGLARDAEIARAAAEATEGPDWYADGLEEDAEDLKRWSVWSEDVVVAECSAPIARQAAVHDPARALRQVDAIQQLIAWQSRAVEDEDREPGMYPPLESETLSAVLGILASIYLEDTDETGDGS